MADSSPHSPTPADAEAPIPAPAPAPPRPRATPRRRHPVRTGMLLTLLGVSALFSAAYYPPAWHIVLRGWLTGQAARQGLKLTIGTVEGTPLDSVVLGDLRLRDHRGVADGATHTDLLISRVELDFTAPTIPFIRHSTSRTWLDQLILDGIRGDLAFDRVPALTSKSGPRWMAAIRNHIVRSTSTLAADLVPNQLRLVNSPDADLSLQNGAIHVRVRGARLLADAFDPGIFQARQVEVRAPGVDNVYQNWAAAARWRGTRLTISGLALSPSMEVSSATLDGSRLLGRDKRIEGDLAVRTLGGEIRGQITARLGGPQLALEIAGSLQNIAVAPLAQLLGVTGPAGGVFRAGQFSFRGDPEHAATGAGSLRVEAADFRWRSRRWQRLVLAATFLDKRVTVHELDLVQSGNRLSLNGEGPLPPAGALDQLTGPNAWWRDRLLCNVDARLNDLRAFGQLLGPDFPEMAGRMSVNGALTGRAEGLNGYLNIEASALAVRQAPLDSLRSTVLFRGNELQVADVQASRGADTLSGKGTFQLEGAPRYAAEVKGMTKDLSRYFPAYAGPLFPEPLRGACAFEWSGDGGPQSHSGAFKVRLDRYATPSGPGAFPRPLDVEMEGSYSPDGFSFRHLNVRDTAKAGVFNLFFEGALPITQDRAELAAGRFFHPGGALTGHAVLTDFALDLLPPLMPGLLRAAGGTLAGWANLGGTPSAPQCSGELQLHAARLSWKQPETMRFDAEDINGDARIDTNVLRVNKLDGDLQAGGSFQIGGRAEWPEANPPFPMELTLQAKGINFLDNATARAHADLTLTLTGTPSAPILAGEVRLRDGAFYRRIEILPAGGLFSSSIQRPSIPSVFLSDALSRWPLADCALALQISATPALRVEARDAGGELTPELFLSGTGRAPVLNGKMEFRKTAAILTGAAPFNGIGEVDSALMFFDAARGPEPIIILPVRMASPSIPRGPAKRIDFVGGGYEMRATALPEQTKATPLFGDVQEFPAILLTNRSWLDTQPVQNNVIDLRATQLGNWQDEALTGAFKLELR